MLRICGPVQDKGLWRPSWNHEICHFYKDLNAVDEIKIRRLGWAGHVVRMEDERIPTPPNRKKKFLVGNFVTKDQWENQEQDGRTSSGGTHHKM